MKGENFTVPAPCLIPLPFWFKPISLFGLVEFTMVQMHLQLPLPWEPGSESDHVQTHETFHRCPLDGLLSQSLPPGRAIPRSPRGREIASPIRS